MIRLCDMRCLKACQAYEGTWLILILLGCANISSDCEKSGSKLQKNWSALSCSRKKIEGDKNLVKHGSGEKIGTYSLKVPYELEI